MHKLLAPLMIATALALSTAVVAAPKGTSSIEGVVSESAHARPMMSASVVALTANGNRWVESTRTGKDGVFRLKGLAAGAYQLLITKPGYRSVEVDGLTVDPNDHLIVGFTIALEAAPFNEQDPVQLVTRCNNLVNPDEVADVYVVCGSK